MYRNYIFDLGGVLLNIDYNLTINAFKELGIPDFQRHYTQQHQDGLFDRLETGKITTGEFIARINKLSERPIPPQKVIAAWNAMLLDFPKEKLNLLKKLKKVHKIFLLSNTNEIHIAAFNQIMNEQHGIKNFDSLFHKVYYSHQLGLRKPDPAIFRHIIAEQNLDPAVTLFIDDSEQHVEGAREAGIKAVLKLPDSPLSQYFT